MIIFSQPIEQSPNYLAFSTAPTMTSVRATSPASNLLTQDVTQVAVADSTTTTINWDFGTARLIDVVALLASNVTHRGTWSVATSTDGTNYTTRRATGPFWANLTATPAAGPYAEDADPRKGSLEKNHAFWYVGEGVASVSARYLRIVVTDTNIANLSFGRLFVGRVFRPATQYQYGSAIRFDDTGVTERTTGGVLISRDGATIVSASVKMDFLSTDEVYNFVYDFNYWRKSTKEMLVCLDYKTTARLQQNLLYCRINEGRQVTASEFNAWSQTWQLERI